MPAWSEPPEYLTEPEPRPIWNDGWVAGRPPQQTVELVCQCGRVRIPVHPPLPPVPLVCPSCPGSERA